MISKAPWKILKERILFQPYFSHLLTLLIKILLFLGKCASLGTFVHFLQLQGVFCLLYIYIEACCSSCVSIWVFVYYVPLQGLIVHHVSLLGHFVYYLPL